ncbi:MAG: peptidylprolyl isomerase [Candidatus Omnitrophica bacterium]|nr:peptidylprolyl isomerase [Candidatus Omnitrophota bacterium]MBU1784109.1 peptidylprolyl isomerase [Candidatus Omnitrophota bacterium]
MLHIFRSKKFARRTLYAILILIIPAFVLWGAGSISKRPGIIGTIGKQKIRENDFVKSLSGVKIQLLLTYANYDVFRNILRNRPLMNRMAWDRLVFLNSSRTNEHKVTNRDVLSYLSQHPLFQKNGAFDQWTYYYIIRNTLGMEPRNFEELVRENLEVNAVQNLLYRKINIPDEELKEYYHTLNDKYDISYILIDKEQFTASAEPSEEEASEYYETNLLKFQIPAKIDIEYIEIPYANITEKKEVTSKINELHMQLEKYPTTFEETAENHGVRYHKTGPISVDDLIPGTKFSKKVHDIAFSMAKEEVSPPVVSGEGEGTAYVLRKLDAFPPGLPGFEEVREAVVEKLRDAQKMKLAAEKAGIIYRDIAGKTLSLRKAAEELDQEVQTAEGVSLGGYIDNVGQARDIIERLGGASAGDIMAPLTTPKGMVITRIDVISPAEEEKFEEQREIIREQVMMDQRKRVLQKWLAGKAPEIKLERSLDTL